jgi:sugar lactone lactonase YvrE
LLYSSPRARTIFGSPAASITEIEPNNTAATATPAALGDSATAAMDTTGDVDWYVINVPSDTMLTLDVDANQVGSAMDPIMWLIAPDSVTTLAFSDDFDGLDSYIEYHITRPGKYFVLVEDYYGDGGAGYFYDLKFGAKPTPPPGPGDPTTLFAQGLGGPYSIAAGPTGELYVTDIDGQQLWKVSPAGVPSQLAPFTGNVPLKVVLEGSGDLLVASVDTSFTVGSLSRVTLGGQVTPFATGLGDIGGMTVGPDGDVWVLDISRLLLMRFGPFGFRKDSIDVSAINARRYDSDLAFSPTGVLYISNGYDAVYRLVNRAPQLLLSGPPYLESIAFDRDGYLYVANGFLGTVLLYDPAGTPVGDAFARSNIGGPTYIAFARGGSGAMTSRLFASNYGYNLSDPYIGSIVEMRQGSTRAGGFRIGIDLLPIATSSLPAAVMGADYTATVEVTSPPGTPTWSIAAGALPPGLIITTTTGVISGVPSRAGSFSFSVRVDAGTRVGYRDLTITVSQPSVSLTDAANHLLGSSQLSVDLQRFLDLQGNKNGRFDIGDMRAYLRAQGQLPSSVAATGKEQP